jgi:DNA polymerase-3 subunit delta'
MSEVADSLWERFQSNHAKQRLAHAILLIGALHTDLSELASRMAMALLCKQQNAPCGQCQSCKLKAMNEHPDVTYLTPEKIGTIIKIDQIRALQISEHRVIIIKPAEKMNGAAANALLKILEEPPPNCYFILITEQISTLPPTIISRCQQWRLPSLTTTYLKEGSYYAQDSGRGKIFSEVSGIVESLSDLIYLKNNVNALASKWITYEFNDLIWLLYLINAQMIFYFFNTTGSQDALDLKLTKLAKRIRPVQLLRQLDHLNGIIKNLNHTLSINKLVALEELLLGYTYSKDY